MIQLKKMEKALGACLIMLLLFSCASYNQQASGFYSNLVQGDYEKASKNLDQNKLLQKSRNRLLYLLEKGRVEHLLGHFEKSNSFLNEADQLMEAAHVSAKDIITGNLINPMMQTYHGEDFEKYMVHYYKALNYLQLNQTEDALVEARRISLRVHAQDDRVQGERYTEDAFSFILQGLIYEKASDANNAFIAYRNAADVYIKNGLSYYGTVMPVQLKKDLLRMAHKNGFMDEVQRYESILNLSLDSAELDAGGELILFWENGFAPIKKEQNLFFSLSNEGGGNFFFIDHSRHYRIPFEQSYSYQKLEVLKAHSFRVVLPRYEPQPPIYSTALVTLNNTSAHLEPAQNISELATATLKERWLKEISKVLTRQAVKKLAEELAKPNEEKKDTKDNKDDKKKYGQLAFAAGLKVFNLASEKADTRNWQSLPHSIYYTRIPLEKGTNSISVVLNQNAESSKTISLRVDNNGSLQFINISTLR